MVVSLAFWTRCCNQQALIFGFVVFTQKPSDDDDDITIWFVPSYPMEFTLVVSIYVVTASSGGASIVLLKLQALRQQGRDLVMIVWALLESVAKFLVVRACLTGVLSHSLERPLLLDPHREDLC